MDLELFHTISTTLFTFTPDVNLCCWIIIHDLMYHAFNIIELQHLFTKQVYNSHLSCYYSVQNLVIQGKSSQTIGLNTNYLVFFKKTSDTNITF